MSTEFRGRPSITLTGFMFSGKSSVGRKLAGRLGLKFIDLDSEIVCAAGSPIERIFAERGESEFRRLERKSVELVLPRPGQVVAVGGGAVIDPINLKIIQKYSCIIWLKVSVETVLERWEKSRGRQRPLLQVEDPEQQIIRLLAERSEFYSRCDFSIESDKLTAGEVVDNILQHLGADE